MIFHGNLFVDQRVYSVFVGTKRSRANTSQSSQDYEDMRHVEEPKPTLFAGFPVDDRAVNIHDMCFSRWFGVKPGLTKLTRVVLPYWLSRLTQWWAVMDSSYIQYIQDEAQKACHADATVQGFKGNKQETGREVFFLNSFRQARRLNSFVRFPWSRFRQILKF